MCIIAALTKYSSKENPRLPAHGNVIPPVDDVTMSETSGLAENAMESHTEFFFSYEIKLLISTHYEMTRKLEVRMTQGVRRSAVRT
jgi:hypothetical protein